MVNRDLFAVLLVLATLGWFSLALIPAFHELFKQTDITPLRIPGGAADIRFFAISFQKQVQQRLSGLKEQSQGSGAVEGGLADGTALRYLPQSSSMVSLFDAIDDGASVGNVAVMSESSLHIPALREPLKEVYTSGDLEGEYGNVYRALLVEGNATLGPSSVVIRWVDVGGDLTVAAGSTLWGRASAGWMISLASGVAFQRVAAPRVVFGEPNPDAASRKPAVKPVALMEPPKGTHVSAGRWVIHGDLTVPADTLLDSAVVVSGTLRLERGAWITGGVKAAVIDAADHCVFRSSLVAADRITLGDYCEAAGPLVAERDVCLGDGCRLGTIPCPTTVTALEIRLGRDCELSGEAWARHSGLVEQPATAAR